MLVDRYGYWSPRALPVGSTVWHYTSSVGLIGMLRNREIWATDCTSLNDVSEIREGFACIRTWLEDVIEQNSTDERPRRGQFKARTVAGLLLQLVDDDTIDWAQRVFIVCASLDGDDAGQWRLYGGPRAGYAVELDTSAPLQVLPGSEDEPRAAAEDDRDTSSAVATAFKMLMDMADVSPWYPVAYTTEERGAMLTSLLEWAIEQNDEYEEAKRDAMLGADEQSDLGQDLAERLRDALASAAALIKSPGFRGEREARVVVNVGYFSRHTEFRGTDHGVIQYLRLAAGAGAGTVMRRAETAGRSLPVRSITVRRTPYFDAERRTLQALVSRSGFPETIAIRQSTVELRW